MTYNIKTGKEKILRIWITIISHGGSGHEVQESWPYLKNISGLKSDLPPKSQQLLKALKSTALATA